MKTALCFLVATLGSHAAVTLNQLETFSGDHGWTSGPSNPNPPVVGANSGPLAAGDNALLITSNGSGDTAGGRLVAFNQSVWTGDYIGEGIVAIAAALRNGGNTNLSVRLAFDGPGGRVATAAVQIAASSDWLRVLFDVSPASLTGAGGTSAAATMAAVTEMRILHASGAGFIGDPVTASLFADNIQAVPEPASILFAGLAGALLLARKRRDAPTR